MKKKDTIPVDVIDAYGNDTAVGEEPLGEDGKAPSCIYNHKTHAVGSIIKHKDGSESICTKDGTWERI